MGFTPIEIVGILISIIITIIVALFTKGKNRTVDWGTTFSWFLISLLITSHISTRAEMSKTTSIMEFYSEFKDNPSSVELARNELDAKKIINDSQIAFFSKIFGVKNTRYESNLNSFKSIKISYNITNLYELGEMQNDVIEIFNTSNSNTTIRATSYVNVDQWWTNEFGKEYSRVNQEAIDRGVDLTRIWIFESPDDFKKTINDLKYQKEVLGVKTFYVFENDIQDLNESKIDVILIDDNVKNKSYYGELELTPLRKMTAVSFASNNERMSELNTYWDQLMDVAKKY
jgi:hypothetical protein